MHKSLPVTPSDKRMSKRHLRARIRLGKRSVKMNREHKMDHEKAEKHETAKIGEAQKRLRTVERM
jgi:hypothetical protein